MQNGILASCRHLLAIISLPAPSMYMCARRTFCDDATGARARSSLIIDQSSNITFVVPLYACFLTPQFNVRLLTELHAKARTRKSLQWSVFRNVAPATLKRI